MVSCVLMVFELCTKDGDFKEDTSKRLPPLEMLEFATNDGGIFRNVSKSDKTGELSYRTMFACMRGWCAGHANRFTLIQHYFSE